MFTNKSLVLSTFIVLIAIALIPSTNVSFVITYNLNGIFFVYSIEIFFFHLISNVSGKFI